MGPLAGIKVLDLSRILAGPWATQCLADFGATVLKIERPGAGDDTRHWGPPWVRDAKGGDTGEAAYYASTNRGKRSVAVDFTKPAGQQLLRSLSMRADVLIENFKVGTLAKYRLGYESLRRLNPRLVYCSISAFGQDGPRKDEAGYDATGTLRWAVGLATQAMAFLDGRVPNIVMAASGRRVPELEWDLLMLIRP